MPTVGDVAITDAATATPALPANLFALNQSDVETDLVGFFAQGAAASGQGPFVHGGVTLLRDLAAPGGAWHATAACKATTDGGGTFQNVEIRVPVAGQFVAGGAYTLSAWIYSAAGGPVLRFYLQADTGSIGTVGSITLAAGWNRYSITKTLPNPITQAYFALRFDTGGVAQAITLWMDGLQCEAGPGPHDSAPGHLPACLTPLY